MMISLSYQFILAWVTAFLFSTIANLIIGDGASIEYLIGGSIILAAALILFNKLKNKSSGCSSCSSCSSCPSHNTCGHEYENTKNATNQ